MSVEFNNLMVSDSANKLEVAELSELIEDRLYFMVLSNHKGPTTLQTFRDWKISLKDNDVFYLNVDDNLVYDGFYSDFGPLNIAMIYRYIGIVRDKFKAYKKIIHCAHIGDQKKRSNAAFLICAYLVIENNWTAYQTYNLLSQQYKYKYLPFRDASCLLQSEYSVSVEECVNALYKAKWYGFFDMSDFDLDEYEKYETVKYGDINWIVPATLLAFSSPHSRDYIDKSGYQIHSPAYYYSYFKENNVKHVVRLNSKKTYDAKRTFVAVANIQHTDLVFTDGTPPSDSILKIFLRLCEQYIDDCDVERTNNEISESNEIFPNTTINSEVDTAKYVGAVAVHCKAGLGRTGCLVASYIVKHWSFTAVEAIAWTRICRPGSVIGVQQQWLIDKEEYLTTLGKQWREKRKNAVNKYKRFINGIYSAKRGTSNANAYEYVDPPPHLHISNEAQFTSSSSSSGNSEICEESEEYKQNRLSSVLKNKLKTNNHTLPDVQNDVYVPNLRQKRSASKIEDPKPKSTFSALKNIRRVTNASIGISMNSLVKKNNTTPTITITRSSLKASIKNTKPISVCKTSTKSTRTHTSETATKITEETKPSYALATVASSARMSKRLRNQNCITK